MQKDKSGKELEKKTTTRDILLQKRRFGKRGTLYFLVLVALIIFIGVVSIALYVHYKQENLIRRDCTNLDKEIGSIDNKLVEIGKKMEVIKSSGSNDEEHRLLLRAANKYHLVLFSYQITQKIKDNLSYENSLKEFEKFATGYFDTELNVLKNSMGDVEFKNAKLLEGLRKVIATPNKSTETHSYDWRERIKHYFTNVFKIKKIEESNKVEKNNQVLIGESIEKILLGDNEQALSKLRLVFSKDVEFAVKILESRVAADNAAKKIMSENLIQ